MQQKTDFQLMEENCIRLTPEQLNDDGVVMLAEAIIEEIVKEYKNVINSAAKFPDDELIAEHYYCLVRYLNSPDFHCLTLGNGKASRYQIQTLYGKMPDEYYQIGKDIHRKRKEEEAKKKAYRTRKGELNGSEDKI